MGTPLVSLIVPTFERPASLRLVLLSLERQTGLADSDMEIVVADDGSQDHTHAVVKSFQAASRFRVVFVTHEHDGFQLARTRNDGVRASTAPYLIFLDGDCVAPADHVQTHLRHRRRRTAMAGFCYYLDRDTTNRIDEAAVHEGAFERWTTRAEKTRLRRMAWKARLYSWLNHPRRPKLYGGAFAIARRDYEAVNGFNEEFIGWGCEDDEFAVRLRRAGIRIRSILHRTPTYHLWHPPVPSYPASWKHGENVTRLEREAARTSPRCTRGLYNPAA